MAQDVGLGPEPIWTGAENFKTTGFLYPDCAVKSESLDHLRYIGPVCNNNNNNNNNNASRGWSHFKITQKIPEQQNSKAQN
jgi:hypothetical protein